MRRVAISTIWKYYLLSNYGSFLQHYALREILKRNGFEPFRVIDANVENRSLVLRAVECIKNCLRPIYWRLRRHPARENLIVSLRFYTKMERLFLKDYKQLIGKFYEDQLFDDETIGVQGGDQVLRCTSDYMWSHKIKECNPLIAYAASTDWCEDARSIEWRELIAEKLKSFSFVGIRESRGAEIVGQLLNDNVKVKHVADPVQLLSANHFKGIECQNTIFKKPTLLCYLVNIRSEEDLRINQLEDLSRLLKCDLKIVGIQGGEVYVPKHYQCIYSPRQFLRALDDASYFITNSYHGSVLAILYHKQFLSIWQNCLPGTDQNERQKELMYKFNLHNNWVNYKLDSEQMFSALTKEIDWYRVDEIMQNWRKQSLEFLLNAITKALPSHEAGGGKGVGTTMVYMLGVYPL